jgi:probable rRNA maturation factor
MPISVASPRRAPRIAPALRALVRATLALQDRKPGEIAVVLTDDATIRDLNLRYRSLDRATDVLSFGYDEEPWPRTGKRAARAGARVLSAAGASGAAGGGSGPAARARTAPVSGDIVISLDRVRVQARRYRATKGRELARLVIHGALHLAGLEHRTRAQRLRMRREEARVLRASAAHVSGLERALGVPVTR